MKTFLKILLAIPLAACFPKSLAGQEVIGESYPVHVYSIRAGAEYQYNATYGHQAAFNVMAVVPVGFHFDFQPAVQASTANYYTAALQTKAKFNLPAGRLYLKNRLVFKDVARSNMYDFCMGLSAGYEWDYIDVEVGMFSRFMDSFGRDYHSLDATLCEPFNLIYSIKGLVRPGSSRWNLTLGMSNVDIFEMERGWQPIFSMGGKFAVNNRLLLNLDAFCKPAGMFHLNAEFYAAIVRFGVTYRLFR